MLTEACRLVGEALGTDLAKIMQIEHEENALLVRAGVGWPEGVVGEVWLPMGERSSETFAIRKGKPVITEDIETEDRFGFPGFLKAAGVVSIVNVPIILAGGEPYGLLQVDSRERAGFAEDDIQFLRTYAPILGPVIDRLFAAGEASIPPPAAGGRMDLARRGARLRRHPKTRSRAGRRAGVLRHHTEPYPGRPAAVRKAR